MIVCTRVGPQVSLDLIECDRMGGTNHIRGRANEAPANSTSDQAPNPPAQAPKRLAVSPPTLPQLYSNRNPKTTCRIHHPQIQISPF